MWNTFEKGIPENLRDLFKRKHLDPLELEVRDEHIAVQLSAPPEIERIQGQIKALAPKEEAAKSKRVRFERMLADVQADLKAAKEEEQTLHWQAADLRGQIESLKARQAQFGSTLLVDFISEMMVEWEKLRNAGAEEFRQSRPKGITGQIEKSVWSNREAVDRAITYVRAAMVRAEAMRSEPLTDAEVKVRLDQLRENIPDNGVWERIELKSPQFIEQGYDRYGGEVRLPANY